jgi:hypothetical protein
VTDNDFEILTKRSGEKKRFRPNKIKGMVITAVPPGCSMIFQTKQQKLGLFWSPVSAQQVKQKKQPCAVAQR